MLFPVGDRALRELQKNFRLQLRQVDSMELSIYEGRLIEEVIWVQWIGAVFTGFAVDAPGEVFVVGFDGGKNT